MENTAHSLAETVHDTSADVYRKRANNEQTQKWFTTVNHSSSSEPWFLLFYVRRSQLMTWGQFPDFATYRAELASGCDLIKEGEREREGEGERQTERLCAPSPPSGVLEGSTPLCLSVSGLCIQVVFTFTKPSCFFGGRGTGPIIADWKRPGFIHIHEATLFTRTSRFFSSFLSFISLPHDDAKEKDFN